MKDILRYLFTHQTLFKDQAKDTLKSISQGVYSEAEIAAFITVYLMRPITPDELAGFREALLDLCIPVDCSDYNTIDVCGTGGDEKNTFNISTATAFVLAGAGIKVAKHGNYSASSVCGSSNLLEYFGYRFSNESAKIRKELEQTNFSYLHAPLFHPAMKQVGPVRKILGVRTFFNLLGPMVNPAKPQNQLVGVYNQEVLELYSQVYKNLGLNYTLLHNLDGYDEISLTNPFRVISKFEDRIFSPEDIQLSTIHPIDLAGGNSIGESAKLFINLLEGKGTKAQNNVVAANAAFGIKCIFPEKSIAECLATALESLEKGKALTTFKKLIEIQP